MLSRNSVDNMVFYIIVICIFAAQVLAEEETDSTSCSELLKLEAVEKYCCDLGIKWAIESCKDAGKEWECSSTKCNLEKYGILDGETIDDVKATDMFDKGVAAHPERKIMYERVQSRCLGGKYEAYPKEACPLMKFQACSYLNSIVECPSWQQNDACQIQRNNAIACKTLLDKAHQSWQMLYPEQSKTDS